MDQIKVTDIVIAISSVVTALTIVVFVVQAVIMYKQVKKDHERSRRERAVDLILHWSESLKRENSAARKLLESLSDHDNKAVYEQQPIEIDDRFLPHVQACISSAGMTIPAAQNGKISLDIGAVSVIRFLGISYLNSLESVLLAWHTGVAHEDTIKRQFSYLYDKHTPYNALEKLRRAAGGGQAYPAIECFMSTYSGASVDPPLEQL